MTRPIEDVLHDAAEWLSREGVEGVGQGEADGMPCIVAYVSSAAAERALPHVFEGYPVRIERTPKFKAY